MDHISTGGALCYGSVLLYTLVVFQRFVNGKLLNRLPYRYLSYAPLSPTPVLGDRRFYCGTMNDHQSPVNRVQRIFK